MIRLINEAVHLSCKRSSGHKGSLVCRMSDMVVVVVTVVEVENGNEAK
jgi:hypothetical protein